MSNLCDEAARTSSSPRAFRWRLSGGAPPGFALALRLGEATRSTVLRTWETGGRTRFPDGFHADGSWLPEDLDGDGRIDHMLLHVGSGLPAPMLPALAAGGRVFLRNGGVWRLEPVWMGQRAENGAFAKGTRWVTATPYVTPRSCWRRAPSASRSNHAERPDRDPRRQIERDIAARGWPTYTDMTVSSASLDQFVPGRRHHALRYRRTCTIEIGFAREVAGPMALGYGSHLGLGLFRPLR